METEAKLKIIGGLAVVFGRDLTKEAIQVYLAALDDLPLVELRKAASLWMNQKESPFFPTPGQLRGQITISDDELSREAVGNIINAISKCGPHDVARAQEKIGSLGWGIVKLIGGWNHVCGLSYEDIGPTAHAQWRELGKTIVKKHRLGLENTKPELPMDETKKLQIEGIKTTMTDLFKSMP